MKPLTDTQRRALHLAAHKGGAPVSPKPPKGSVRTQTANRLVANGWATLVNETLLITKAGRAILAAPMPEGPGTYLKQRWGTTHRLDLAVRDEPEVMAAPDESWRLRAEAHRKLSREDLDAARLSGLSHPEERLAELRRMAAERGVDVKDELRFVERGLRALSRKVRGEEAA